MESFKEYLYSLATDKRRGIIPSIIKIFLFALSLIYGLIIRLLSVINSARGLRFAPKIISIGNITLGGTGKTTFVEYLAKLLKNRGRGIVVISRGYKRRKRIGSADSISCERLGDEPYMLSLNLEKVPVLSGRDRVTLIKEAVSRHAADTVILDDAFQQWRIKKDIEIVAIDAVNSLGNKQMIPRGLLREPLSALARADVFALTKTNLAGDIKGLEEDLVKFNPRALIVRCEHVPCGLYRIDLPGELKGLDILRGKKIAALSGIGDPSSFEKLLKGAGADIVLNLRYPDHHEYRQNDLRIIREKIKAHDLDTVITTQKDAVRLATLDQEKIGAQVLVLRIELKITKNEENFHSRLFKLYSG